MGRARGRPAKDSAEKREDKIILERSLPQVSRMPVIGLRKPPSNLEQWMRYMENKYNLKRKDKYQPKGKIKPLKDYEA
mgnify:FL=1|tara:strand:+ start:449 stop:682 length:234 start_codon:yes stop_codon:yes gene_type:complete